MAYSLDDSWDNCTPVARAGNACFGLYVRCGIWSARNLTDGFVPGEIAAGYGSPEQTRKLVDVGLWEAVEGGYLAPDYLLRNRPADVVRARQKAEAERKARWREKQHRKGATRDETRDTAVRPAGTDGVRPRSHAPPKGGTGARPRDAPSLAALPAPPPDEHSPRCPYPSLRPDRCPVCSGERNGAAALAVIDGGICARCEQPTDPDGLCARCTREETA